MGENDQGDHFGDTGVTASFSQLLFSDVNENDAFCSDLGPLFSPDHSTVKTPRMLCFDGGFAHHHHKNSPVTCCDSTSYSPTAAVTTVATKPNRRRNGLSQEMEKRNNNSIAKAPSSTQRCGKKIKTDSPCSSTGQPKVKKEKLGGRIAALQQLVSPFGKTDTASVLHEAMGYIKFLHDQLQVLCSAYLHQQPLPHEGKENGGEVEEEPRKELRSRGLCLVPVESTLLVASSNGADYWSPAMSSARQ